MDPSDELQQTFEIEIEKDLYRETPLRYLGYANEVGEAFRAIIGSKLVLATYGVATAYVLADTADKSLQTYQGKTDVENRELLTAFTATDTLVWQMLASVVIPGFTINRLCAGAQYFIKKHTQMAKASRKLAVAGIGLAMIPFIIHPIDNFVDSLMDHTFRKIKPTQ